MARQYSQDSQGNGSKIYLSQEEAQKLDQELMSDEYGFTLEQLMELAGLSCAEAIMDAYPLKSLPKGGLVLVCCGPGNNGGDGLVCARHLRFFGYEPSIYYPRAPKGGLHVRFYERLVIQAKKLDVPFLSYLPKECTLVDKGFDLVVDAVFGFGFKMEKSSDAIRPPFDQVLLKLNQLTIPVCSIDVPSGWDVSGQTDPAELGKYQIKPQMLISLTAPKECAKYFKGPYHYLGGRFLPPLLRSNYDLWIPEYQGANQCVRLNNH